MLAAVPSDLIRFGRRRAKADRRRIGEAGVRLRAEGRSVLSARRRAGAVSRAIGAAGRSLRADGGSVVGSACENARRQRAAGGSVDGVGVADRHGAIADRAGGCGVVGADRHGAGAGGVLAQAKRNRAIAIGNCSFERRQGRRGLRRRREITEPIKLQHRRSLGRASWPRRIGKFCVAPSWLKTTAIARRRRRQSWSDLSPRRRGPHHEMQQLPDTEGGSLACRLALAAWPYPAAPPGAQRGAAAPPRSLNVGIAVLVTVAVTYRASLEEDAGKHLGAFQSHRLQGVRIKPQGL